MRAASNLARLAKTPLRPALCLCACNLLAAALAAQCPNPTTVPNQTISSGTSNYTDNNALSAGSVVINGSASVTFVAGNCIQLLPGFHATAGTAATTFHAWVETAPANVSALPTGGSGFTQQFTWTASSPSGFANLADLFALFNTSVSGVNACYLHYNRASNLLSVANAAGTAWSSGIVPGSSSSTGSFNPYCTLSGSGSSVSGSGTQLAVTVAVTFQASFAGTWNDYLIAYDNEGLSTAWQQMGTWTVPAAPGFSLTLSCPQNMQVWVQSVCTVTAVPSGGFNQNINLALSITPVVGGWAYDSPPAPLAPPNWTSPVHVTPEGGTGGWYEFQITGTSADHTISQTAPVPPVWNVDVTQTPAPLTITTSSLPGGQQGTAYSVTLYASGGTAPYTWSLYSGSLPPGLALSGATIGGTPSAAGTYSFTIKVADTASHTATQGYTVTISGGVLTITTTSLPNGQPQVSYSGSLSATGGTPSYTWSIASGSLPPGIALSQSTGALTGAPTATGNYNFTAKVTDQTQASATQGLTLAVQLPPSPLMLPSPITGVEYFPRGHAWWSMLWDWGDPGDCTSTTLPQAQCAQGMSVPTVVQSDLQTLKNPPGGTNKFNFIHLYVWDQDMVQDTLAGVTTPLVSQGYAGYYAPGFVGWDDGGPSYSPTNHDQWAALKAFVRQAAEQGLYVQVDFASSRAHKEIDSGMDPATVGSQYGAWIGQFIDLLAPYQNVLVWGIGYGVPQPSSADPSDPWGKFWKAAYPLILQKAQQYPYSTYSGGRALVSLWPSPGYATTQSGFVQDKLGGYQYEWSDFQTWAYNFRNQVGTAPDLFSIEAYNSNEEDFATGLQCVAGTPNSACSSTPARTCGFPTGNLACDVIPTSKLIVTEFATGSSLEPAPIGNNTAGYLDNQTPTTTAVGQAGWLQAALCAFRTQGLNYAAGYYGMYDSLSWWEWNNFNYSAQRLAELGFWGLVSEYRTEPGIPGWSANKPAWTTATTFNYPQGCSTPSTPVVAAQTDATYYTINDTATVTYTASNVTSLSFNETLMPDPYASYSCDTGSSLSENSLAGSCAFTHLLMSNLTPPAFAITGANQPLSGGFAQASAQLPSVTVALSPAITGSIDFTNSNSCDYTANPGCVLTVSQTDTIELFGLGFNPDGGNLVKVSASNGDTWFPNDGLYFWDGQGSRQQINVQLGTAPGACFLAAGPAVLVVKSPNSGTPSASIALSVAHGAGCP